MTNPTNPIDLTPFEDEIAALDALCERRAAMAASIDEEIAKASAILDAKIAVLLTGGHKALVDAWYQEIREECEGMNGNDYAALVYSGYGALDIAQDINERVNDPDY